MFISFLNHTLNVWVLFVKPSQKLIKVIKTIFLSEKVMPHNSLFYFQILYLSINNIPK